MSKELRALNRIKDFMSANAKHWKQDIGMIETALKRLKTVEEENKLLRENNANLDDTYFDTWYACERLKESCDYALMFVDNVYCLVDTNKNKFDVIDIYKIKNHGIIDNGTQKKLKALEIIKKHIFIKDKKIYTKEWEWDLTQEEYDILKEVLL